MILECSPFQRNRIPEERPEESSHFAPIDIERPRKMRNVLETTNDVIPTLDWQAKYVSNRYNAAVASRSAVFSSFAPCLVRAKVAFE